MNQLAISSETISLYASTNMDSLKTPARGLVLAFPGLGGAAFQQVLPPFAETCARAGVVYAMPYINPWSWMNDEAVALVDALVEAVFEAFGLPEGAPILSTGGSMGGLCSLIYARYAKRTPSAVASNCPVCDLVFHATERGDLPRTIYSAFRHYACGLERAVELTSPLHIARELPDIPYHIAHCDADKSVNKAAHSDKLVAKLRALHRDVTYDEVPGMGHCQLTPDAQARYEAFVLAHAAPEA